MEVFLAIAVLATLALLATSRRLYRVRRNKVLAGLATGGWIHVLIGVAVGPYGLHLVEVEQVPQMTPVVLLGLGWIGFMVGLQANWGVIKSLPGVVVPGAVLDSVLTLAVIGGGAWVGVRWWLGGAVSGVEVVSMALLVGAASIGWSLETRSLHINETAGAQRLAFYVRTIGSIAAMLSVVALGLWTVVQVGLEDGEGTGMNWGRSGVLFVASIALPVLVGLLARFTLSLAGTTRSEQLVAFLGIVVFASGIAAQLSVSPILAAVLTGAIVANLPGWELSVFQRFIVQAEHVIAAVFALLAGVLMDPALGLGGIALVVGVVVLRIALKPSVLRVMTKRAKAGGAFEPEIPKKSTLYLGPVRQQALAPALVLSVWLLDPSNEMQRLLAAVLLIGILSELLVLVRGAVTRSRVQAAEARAEAQGEGS